MTRKPTTHASAADLRRRAEARLRRQQSDTAWHRTEADTKRLLHELQVHQVELEVQNAELSRAHTEAEANAEKFTDLYDFAPVAYFTFSPQGDILEVNLTGATLLAVERRRLLGRRFQLWVAPEDVGGFNAFLKRTFGSRTKQVCEINLLTSRGANVPVQIEGFSLPGPGAETQVRAVVVDLTERKRAEEGIRKFNTELEARVAARTAEISALLEQSRHMQEQLRHLSRLVLRAQEQERKRISRELHDQVAQGLICINLDLMALARAPMLKPRSLKRWITRTQRLVEESVNNVHRVARELRPTVLDDLGLIPALRDHLRDLAKRTGLRVRFTAFAGVEQLNTTSRTVLYRVTQSALTNIVQHAKASRVKVAINKYPRGVCMEIADNGKSFRVEEESLAKRHKHLGLLGMKERVEMVGGTFSIESLPGQGTTIRVEIPLDQGDEGGRLRTIS